MTRPDGALLVAAGVGATGGALLLPASWRDGEPRSRLLRRVGTALATWAVVYGAYFLWRWTYYGALLPNTFYLKVGDTFAAIPRGLDYTRTFAEDRLFVPVLVVSSVLALKASAVRWLLLYVLAHVGYVIYVGGDFYSGHRFYVVLLPFLYLLAGAGLKQVLDFVRRSASWQWARERAAFAAPVVGLSVALVANGLYHFVRLGFQRGPFTREILAWSETVDNNVRYMKWLGTVAPPGATILIGDIGAAGFFANLTVIDVYGITDPRIAHQQVETLGRGKPGHEKFGTRDYLLGQNPTYAKWGYVSGDLHSRGFYVFTDFPAGLRVPGLWVREDRPASGYVAGSHIRFTRTELSRWRATGLAFRKAPTRGSPRGQQPAFGYSGTYLSSWAAPLGDQATGRIQSPPFPLVGDVMLLRVGGGRDAARLRVSLLVEGRAVASATGHDFEVLGRREWPIAAYRGKQGVLEVVDESTDGWGHIMVDEVVQWRADAPTR